MGQTRIRPSLHPQKLTKTAWFYETKNGIEVVAELRSVTGVYQGTVVTEIPWSKIEKSFNRCVLGVAR